MAMATNAHLLNCPPLRFPEFNDEWKQTTLGEVAEINPTTKDVLPHKFRYIDLEVVEKGILLKHNIISKDNAPSRAQRLLKEHDVLFQMVRPYQQNNLYFRSVDNVPSVASTGYAQLRSYQSGKFLYYAIHSATFLGEVLNRCTGTNYPAINTTDLASLHISLPSFAEQSKIAEFLSLLDERIETQRQTIEERKAQKKALLHQLFSQSLRFPEFSDKWQQTTLGKVAERVTRKNSDNITLRPLTISAQYGLIDQRDFFDKVVASSNLEGYYLLKKGEFAYNRSSSSSSPWGTIKRLEHYNDGALSTLYICFSLVYGHPIFFSYLFETTNWYNHIQSVSAEGARNHGLLNIAVSDFFDMPISLPSLEEQKKVAELFTIFDERIEVEEALLKCYEAQKRYLLRQMFV